MLKITLEANEKPKNLDNVVQNLFPTHTYQHQVVLAAAATSKKMATVAAARQAIIEAAVKACPHKVGDEVQCFSLEAQELHGKDIVINKIVTSYAQIKNDWPDNDVPMIIHGYSRDKKFNFICTSAYLIGKNEIPSP
jgi:hypothetical protein